MNDNRLQGGYRDMDVAYDYGMLCIYAHWIGCAVPDPPLDPYVHGQSQSPSSQGYQYYSPQPHHAFPTAVDPALIEGSHLAQAIAHPQSYTGLLQYHDHQPWMLRAPTDMLTHNMHLYPSPQYQATSAPSYELQPQQAMQFQPSPHDHLQGQSVVPSSYTGYAFHSRAQVA